MRKGEQMKKQRDAQVRAVKLYKKWIDIKSKLPPEGKVVMTKIEDKNGERNKQPLKRIKNLWFLPDGSVYVYYIPTHWRDLRRD